MFFKKKEVIEVRKSEDMEIVIRLKNSNGKYSKEISMNNGDFMQAEQILIDCGGNTSLPKIQIERFI